MSAGLCIAVADVDAHTVLGLCELAASRNIALYRAGRVRRAPWDYRWVPDELVQCDATGCKVATVAMVQDVVLVDALGVASCGSLAAAYVGWLTIAERRQDARIALRELGRGNFHAVAICDGRTFDPAKIGARG